MKAQTNKPKKATKAVSKLPGKRLRSNATAQKRLADIGIDVICEQISNGTSLTDIAKSASTSFAVLQTWLDSEPEYSMRAREARIKTARFWDDQATARVDGAKDKFQLDKARELAHHYRWRASKIAPKEYGDKTIIAGDSENPLELNITKMINSSDELLKKIRGE
jgi:hypothetical protein